MYRMSIKKSGFILGDGEFLSMGEITVDCSQPNKLLPTSQQRTHRDGDNFHLYFCAISSSSSIQKSRILESILFITVKENQ